MTAPINLAAVRVMRCNLRKDGWPRCRHCGEDEFAIFGDEFAKLATAHWPKCPPITDLLRLDWFCYRCAADVWRGSFRVVSWDITTTFADGHELAVRYVPTT